MGGSLCCTKRDEDPVYSDRIKEFTKDEKIELFKRVTHFNWNIKKKGGILFLSKL